MPANLLIRHWKKQVLIFQQNLALLKKQKQTNGVHDLRVAVKKMRSYLKLLNLARRDNYTLAFDGTEKLFNVLGKYRDIEMAIALTRVFERQNKTSYKVFNDHLSLSLLQLGKWVQTALYNFDEIELNGLTYQLEQDLRETNREELIQKFQVVIDKEYKKAIRHTQHFNRDTHQVRKIFKEIFYWAELAPGNVLVESNTLQKIKKVLRQLGDWQDHELLHQKVRHFRKDFVPSVHDDYQLLQQLESNILDRKERLLEKAKSIAEF